MRAEVRVSLTSLGQAVHALARAHRSRLTTLLAPHGIHPGQDQLLFAIWVEPGLRQAALAARLGVEPATVTRMLQRLEKSGLIERRADRHDGRVLRVHPTPRSRLIEPAVRRAWDQLDEMMVEALGGDAGRLQRLARAASVALGGDTASITT